jgi:DNA primase
LLEWVLFKILNMAEFDRFIEPKAVKDMLDEYKEDNDFYYSFVVGTYIPNGYHELRHVPLPIIKQWLKEYTEDEGIQNANLYRFGKKVLAVLNKESDGTYTIKTGRVPLEDYKTLDPNDFYDRKLRGVPKGIHRDDKK